MATTCYFKHVCKGFLGFIGISGLPVVVVVPVVNSSGQKLERELLELQEL
jgi:hypothetical protein